MAVTVGASPPTNAQKAALKTAFDLDNVDNTADADKPVSTATQTALAARLLASARLSEFASDPAAQAQALANLGIATVDGGTFF